MVLLYSTVDDGFSIITLYRKVIGLWVLVQNVFVFLVFFNLFFTTLFIGKSRYIEEEPSLVVVRDEGGHVFGGYANEQWRKVTRDEFYGDEDCFVFSVKPEQKVILVE